MDHEIQTCEVGWGMGSVVPHREPNHVVGFIEDDHGMRRAVCQHHYDFVRADNTFCWHVVAINELGDQKHADFKSAADSFNEAAGNAATSIHDATPALRTLADTMGLNALPSDKALVQPDFSVACDRCNYCGLGSPAEDHFTADMRCFKRVSRGDQLP